MCSKRAKPNSEEGLEIMNKKKISIDFLEESFNLLEEIKKEYNFSTSKKISNSFIVNTLVNNVFGCPTKNEVVKALKSLQDHYKLMAINNEEAFFREDINSKIENLYSLILLFEKFELNENNTVEQNMRKLKMRGNKNIVFPSNWWVLNESEAIDSSNAYVVACIKHSECNVPHFVFFGDETVFKYNDYTDDFKNKLYKMILHVYPDFSFILEQQANLNYANGEIINSNQCIHAPTVEIFKIIDSETLKEVRASDTSYNPPYGAFIQIAP